MKRRQVLSSFGSMMLLGSHASIASARISLLTEKEEAEAKAKAKAKAIADGVVDDEELEEEKKKSTLVSDVEEFGRGPTRIALLLPDIEGPFRFAADAVLRGFQAAHRVDGRGVYVRVVRVVKDEFGLDDAREAYEEFTRQKFNLVVGPLIRSSVNSLSAMGDLPVPTLALNLPDQDKPIPTNCILYSLAIEYEGRSAARFAYAETYQRIGGGRPPRAIAISDKRSLSRRSANAFMEGWQAYGGELEPPIISNIRSERSLRRALAGVRADIVFMAIDPEILKKVRHAISDALPIYGTSQLNTGAVLSMRGGELLASPELNGVRVVEMPWQLLPEHPGVAAYPRSRRLPHLEMQRLYAFGIDAYRVARELLAQHEQFTLDGVSGQLVLDAQMDPRVLRVPILGEYREGILVPAYASEPDEPASGASEQETVPGSGQAGAPSN